MATRSSISIQTSKDGGKTIYCHWDGYPSNNGRILKEFYNTETKVKELIALGNLSILGESIGTKTAFDSFDSRKNPQCLAYGRDREETEQEATDFIKKPSELQNYNYLFKNDKWYVRVNDNNRYTLLTDKMINKD